MEHKSHHYYWLIFLTVAMDRCSGVLGPKRIGYFGGLGFERTTRSPRQNT